MLSTIIIFRISIRLGEWNIDTGEDCSDSPNGIRVCVPDKPVDVGIEETIPHKEYIDERRAKANDIALVRLVKAIKFSGINANELSLTINNLITLSI